MLENILKVDCILPGIYTGTEFNDTGLHAVFPGEGRRDGGVIAIKSHSIPHAENGNQNEYISFSLFFGSSIEMFFLKTFRFKSFYSDQRRGNNTWEHIGNLGH